jgi:hypothetical protein
MAIDDAWELDWKDPSVLKPYRDKSQAQKVAVNVLRRIDPQQPTNCSGQSPRRNHLFVQIYPMRILRLDQRHSFLTPPFFNLLLLRNRHSYVAKHLEVNESVHVVPACEPS